MANYKPLIAWIMLIMALVVTAPLAEGATMTCGTVAQNLAPCLNYLRSGGSQPLSAGCCTGIRSLNSAAQTTADRQAVCGCLKSAAQALPNVNMGLAGSVPSKCGVNLPYKLDPSTDCSKIQ